MNAWGAVINICSYGPSAILLVLWLWVVLGFGIARPIYRKHYKKRHGHYPGRKDVPRWVWILLALSPVHITNPSYTIVDGGSSGGLNDTGDGGK